MQLAQWRQEPDMADLDDEQIVDIVHQVYYSDLPREQVAASLGVKPAPEAAKPRSFVAAANDTVIELANAAAGGVQAVGDFIAPGNRMSQGIKSFIEEGEASQSDVVKQGKAKFRGEVEAADSFGGEAAAVGRYIADNPLQAAAQAAGSFAIPGAAVKTFGMAAKAAGLGAKGVAAAGTAGGMTAGAALGGGDAAGTAHELVMQIPAETLMQSEPAQALAAQGADEATIRQTLAEQAGRDASIIPAIIGAASGAFGAERVLAGGAKLTGAKGAAKVGLIEGAGEFIEEGATNFEGRRAAASLDPSIDPMKGTGAAATMGGVLGFGTGAGVNLLARKPTVEDVLQADTVDDAIAAAQGAVNLPTAVAPPVVETAKAGLDEPAPGFVRYYHGGNPTDVTGSLWFTSDRRDADGWANRDKGMSLWYVDVPENDPVRGGDPQFGVLPPSRMEFPAEIASKRRQLAPTVPSTAPTPQAEEDPFSGPIPAPATPVAPAVTPSATAKLDQAEARMHREAQDEAQSLRQYDQLRLPRKIPKATALPDLDAAIQPGDLLQKSGALWPEKGARLKAKSVGGTVVEVKGGFIVRPAVKETAPNIEQAAPAAPAVASSPEAAKPSPSAAPAPVAQPAVATSAAPLSRAAAIESGPAIVLQNRDRSSAASISQMNEIASKPDYLRAGPARVMETGAPVAFGEMPASAVLGQRQEIADGKGDRVSVQYAVVEAGDLLASHLADGSAVPQYEQGEPGKLRAVAGNGRAAGITAGYSRGTASQYRQDLEADAASMGLDPAAIGRMRSPVLVRVMAASDVRADIGDRSNIAGSAKLSPTEQAATDARRLDLTSLAFDDSGEPTAQAVRQFTAGMPTAERGELINPDGSPTRQAVDRLMAATFKQAYGSDELVRLYAQATDREARTIMAALADAAGVMAGLKDAGDLDIRGAVAEAAGLAVNARRKGIKLADLLKNADIEVSGEALEIARFMADNIRSAKRISEGLRDWAGYAAQQVRIARDNEVQDGMFGATPVASRGEVFRRLNDEQAQAAAPQTGRAGGAQPVADGVERRQDDAAAGPAGAAAGTAEDSREGLVAPSRADILAQQERAEDADALDERQQIDREAAGQTLTAQNAPEQRSDSSGDMFAREKAEAEIDKRNAGRAQEADPNQPGMFSRGVSSSDGAKTGKEPRSWYDAFVARLPESYRNDPHRREPISAEDRNALTPAAVREQVEALNVELRGPNDKKGHGPITVDALGNLTLDARDTTIDEILDQVVALADSLDYGVYVTGVRSPFVPRLRDAGFVSEAGLGAIADRVMNRTPKMPTTVYEVQAKGAIMAYKPRGFGMVLFKRDGAGRTNSPARELRMNEMEQQVSQMTRDWLRKPEIHVIASMDEAPDRVRQEWMRQDSQGAAGGIEGFHYRGGVYLLADALVTQDDLRRVLYHESLGHFGLRGVFGDALKQALDGIVVGRRKEVAAKAKQYGLDMSNAADRLMAAEEVLAELAQTRPELGIVQRAIAAIRTWLRSHGFKNLELTDDEIVNNYLIPARGFVERGRGKMPSFARGTNSVMASRKDVTVGGLTVSFDGKQFPVDSIEDAQRKWNEFRTFASRSGGGVRDVGNGVIVRDGSGKELGRISYNGRFHPNESPAPNRDGAPAFERSQGNRREVQVDGQWRPAENADGQPVHPTFAGQKAFYRWFGDSAVVDESGRPRVVYHGTKADITEFKSQADIQQEQDPEWRYGNEGIYFASNVEIANAYGRNGTNTLKETTVTNDGAVYPVYLNIRNPFVVGDGRRFDPGSVKARIAKLLAPEVFASAGAVQELRDRMGNSGTFVAAKDRAELEAMGFDGILSKSAHRSSDVWIAFDPNQIKSALGNNGQFSADDDNIMFSRSVVTGLALPQTWQAPDVSKMDDFIYTMQDKHVDTKRVLKAVRGSIGAIADQQDPYLQEELFHGRAAKATKDFLETQVRPLLTEMQARGVDMSDFEEYLHNRHAERRNVQVAKVNPNMQDGGSGIKTADARAYLAGLPAAKATAYKSLARRVDQINKDTRALLVSSGLEKQETIDAWDAAYGDEYVPLMREEMDNGSMGIGQGFSVRGSSSKRAMGSDKPVANIMANIALQREKAITRSEKRRIGEALYGLVLKAPNDDFWFAIDPALQNRRTPNQIMATQLQLISMGMDPLDAENIAKEPTQRYIGPDGKVHERINPALRSADNVLAVRINGEDKYVFFNAKDERAMRMAKSLKNLDADQLGTVMGTVAKMTRYFSAINTQWNPLFGVVNITRDVQAALLNLNSTALADHKGDVMKHVLPALRGIYIDLREHRAGRTPTSSYAAIFEEFQREGGATGFRDMYANAQERADDIAGELKAISDGTALKLGKGIMAWLSDYNESMENAVRVAAYKVGKEQGMSNQQAASLAKNLTVNFNRKGQVALQAGALYAFFNAAVQGTARIAQTLFVDGKLSSTGRKIITGGIMLGSMQALLLAMAGFDDDEPPDFVRERSLIIPIGDKKYVSIPMPLGFHVLPNLGRIPAEWAMGGFKNTPKRIGQLIGLFADAFNPIGSAGLSLQTLTPTVIDPLAALSENKDFTGKPIAKKDFDSLHPSAGHTRAKDTATPWAKLISYGTNLATGGTDYKPGLASPTPDQIDYLIGQVTGGVGREVGKLSQVASSSLSGEDLPMHKIPLVGRFVGTTEGQSAEASRFYDNLRQIGEHKAELDGLRKDRKGAEAGAYLRENREALLVPMASRIQRDVSKLTANKRDLIKGGASKERIKLIDMAITARMKQLNDRVRATEKEPG